MKKSTAARKARITATITTWAAALLLASCQTGNQTFGQLDRDQDLKISKNEFRGHIQKRAYDTIDTNSDGTITNTEWTAYEDVRDPDLRFRALDKNRDSKLTFAEFSEVRRKHLTLDNLFGTYDRNEDGYITPLELE